MAVTLPVPGVVKVGSDHDEGRSSRVVVGSRSQRLPPHPTVPGTQKPRQTHVAVFVNRPILNSATWATWPLVFVSPPALRRPSLTPATTRLLVRSPRGFVVRVLDTRGGKVRITVVHSEGGARARFDVGESERRHRHYHG